MSIDGIAQVAFVVGDLAASVRRFAQDLDVGPWLIKQGLTPCEARMRGEPVALEVSVALAYSGSMMIELIEEHGDIGLPQTGARTPSACDFHHLARVTADYPGDRARLVEQGSIVLLEASLPAELAAASG